MMLGTSRETTGAACSSKPERGTSLKVMRQKDSEAVVAYAQHLATYVYIVSPANGYGDLLSQREVPYLCRQETPGLSIFAGLLHHNIAFCYVGAG
jgi:hypothetical protein